MKQVILFTLIAGLLFASCKKQEEKKSEGEPKTENTELTSNEIKTSIITISKAEFLQKVANFETDGDTWKYLGDKPAIVDFYADWCGPCHQQTPILEEIAKEYGQIYVYKVDVDQSPEVARAFGVSSIPTLLFIPLDGTPLITSGLKTKDQLKKNIEDVVLAKK